MTSASEGTAARKDNLPHPDDDRKPDGPEDLHKPSWKLTAKNAFNEFLRDQCTDLAASLTYFSVLALFPGLLAVFSLLGVVGQADQTVDTMLELVGGFAPPDIVAQIEAPVRSMAMAQGSGLALVLGIAGALWSASGYVGAFGRAMNRIYEIDEGRPVWKLKPAMLLITACVVVLVALILVGLVVSGPIADSVTTMIGLGNVGSTIFGIAKWPLILVFVIAIIAMLYYFTPNVRQPKFRWVSVGSIVAVAIWILLSAGFGFYIANFSNYNRTYGALAGVIIFLLWVWITNNALLFGAEIDAEMERSRQLQAGMKAEETLQLPPRDTRQSEKNEAKEQKLIAEGRKIREAAEARGDADIGEHEQAPDAEDESDRDSDAATPRRSAGTTDKVENGPNPRLSDFARQREEQQREE